MILGRLVGTVWATRKNPRLENLKLVVVRPYLWYGPSHPVDHLIAVDRVGAQEGQDVLVCMGLPGRLDAGDTRTPVEASVMAIVDRTEIDSDALNDAQRPFRLRTDHPITTLVLTQGRNTTDRESTP